MRLPPDGGSDVGHCPDPCDRIGDVRGLRPDAASGDRQRARNGARHWA
jgi:hypothetical protein